MSDSAAISSPPPAGAPASTRLGPEDAAIFETFVVPRYLSLFGEPLVAMLAAGEDARVCHLQCRTGYPDRTLVDRLPNAHVHGCDVSEHAIELARAKATALTPENRNVVFDYRVFETLPLGFRPGSFSHAFVVHPPAGTTKAFVHELARIVAPFGQALVAMPLRGSFVEIDDLLRECALKHELDGLSAALDRAAPLRPTDDMLMRELEFAGFGYVESDVRMRKLKFPNGRSFLEDPVTRLLLVPELRLTLGGGIDELGELDLFEYVRDAIDKYWSDGSFEVTVNVGIVGGRRRA